MEDHPSGQVLDDSLQQRLDELLQRASKDSLSGLLNRATMEAHIRSRIDKMKSGESCALFIIDLDSFKLVNDTLGHQAGDSAIGEVARTLSSIFRASDIVGRLGGDEFAVFMSGAIDEDLVRSRGARICSALHMGLGKMRDLELTASVGIALSSGPRKFEALYSQADAALYKAKKSGKNGFCPNTTRQVFQGRCARLRSIVQRRYPKDVRIGAAWADGSFTGRHLVDESRQNMHTETGGVHLSTPRSCGRWMSTSARTAGWMPIRWSTSSRSWT